ncbi:hypothetical protein JKF63_04654 [Porcisia hertigi]|uniref:Uncharacterized protein n=1 Tax=Porcisia hertigi TaxID=2761500 RepID=A0A836LHN1_9TRYP|nr:hypothetical protein JKF63_04654 [Porcisia hertigi]
MIVTGNFGDDSKIIALGDPQPVRNSSTGAWNVTMSVLPPETKSMVKVEDVNGLIGMYSGVPLHRDEPREASPEGGGAD